MTLTLDTSPPPTFEAVEVASIPRSQFLTLETALWFLLGIVALGLRLFDLARWPLSENEAALALRAWRLAPASSGALLDGLPLTPDPLAWNLDALFFTLFGAGDATARLPQAIGGTLLVLSPWLLRPLLGRGHALAASLLLLLSPTALFWSRQASGEVWAALCAVLLVAGVARWWRWGAARDAVLAAVALGVGLASSPGFWSVLAAGALFWAWERWPSRRVDSDTDVSESTSQRPSNPEFARYGAVALLAFLLASTGFLINLAGLGAALNLPVRWVQALFGSPPLVLPFALVLLLYEALALLAGIIGGSQLAAVRLRWAAFGLLWAAITIVPTTLLNSGWSGGLLFVVVPLALLGGAAVVALWQSVAAEGDWRVDGLFVAFSAVLVLYIWINVTAYLASSVQFVGVLSVVVALGMFVAAAILVWQSYGRKPALRVVGLALFLLFSLVSLSSAWGLSLVRGADPREPLVVQPSSTDLRTGAAALAQLSIERYRNPAAIPLGIQSTLGYAPRWYFRNFADARLVEGSRPDLPEAALLAFDAPAPPGRIGQRIWLGPTWPGFPAERPALLRWLVERSEPPTLTDRAAILYLTVPEAE